jgi:hypothetical protein
MQKKKVYSCRCWRGHYTEYIYKVLKFIQKLGTKMSLVEKENTGF